jgi:hypothetical protein
VDQSSPLGKVNPGQTVDAVCIPGHVDLTLQSMGFTAYRVTTLLEETAHIPSRQLLVKDVKDFLQTEPRGDANGAFVL